MTKRWGRLAGEKSTFALKMEFVDDPDHGRAIDPEVAVSWGCFQVWIEGRNLCAHRECGNQLESVYWYLLPLIEWFIHNWNSLFHEERLPLQDKSDTGWKSLHATRFPPPAIENDDEKASAWESEWQRWRMRHALGSASEGGLFPDVVLRRFRDSVEFSWGPVRSAGMPDHFSFPESVGVSRLAPRKVAEPLQDVLTDAVTYLLSLAPESPRLNASARSLHDRRRW